MKLLENRIAIITGGTGALGRAVAEHFLENGAKVAIPYIVDPEVPMLKARLGNRFPESSILLRRADVGQESQVAGFVEEVVRECGKIDALVNLVGGFWGGKPIAETTTQEWQA